MKLLRLARRIYRAWWNLIFIIMGCFRTTEATPAVQVVANDVEGETKDKCDRSGQRGHFKRNNNSEWGDDQGVRQHAVPQLIGEDESDDENGVVIREG